MARGISAQDVLDHIEKGTYTYAIPHSDGINGIVESEFVYIPGFKTAGFPASMVAKGFKNDVILGNVSIAKYPMSHPLATETSKGGADAPNWGSPYAAVSKARKCAWTYVNFDEAKIACEKMDVNNSVAGVTTGAGGADYLIDTGWQLKLIGKKLEIVEGLITYYRRITTIEGHNDKIIFWPELPYGMTTALAGLNNDIRYTRKDSTTNYVDIVYVDGGACGALTVARTGAGTIGTPYVITVTFCNADKTANAAIVAIRADADCNAVVHVQNAPGDNGTGDLAAMGATSLAQIVVGNGSAYTVKRFGLWDPYDWATVKYVTAMHYAVNGMPYPKGNNQYGRDVSDADEIQNYGLPDPDYDDGTHAICKTLTGTGPLSWSHNGQINGICGLNGGVWEWCLCQIDDPNRTIKAGYMGEGYSLPTADGNWATMETVGACGIGDLAIIKTKDGADPDFDNAQYTQLAALRAFLAGESFAGGLNASVFTLRAINAPLDRDGDISFRAAL